MSEVEDDLTAVYLAGYHKRDDQVRALTTDRDALQQRVRELDHEVFRRGEAALKLAEGWSKEAEEGKRLRLLLGMNPQPQGSPR